MLPVIPPSEWQVIKEQAAMAVKSGLLPNSVNTPEKAAVIALKGRELGIPIMQALAGITVISGKPALSAELMLALIFKHCPGAKADIIESTSEKCAISFCRPNGTPFIASFSMEDAKRAGLASNQSWQKYPQAMLRARTISAGARAVFPDAIMGCYTPEELGADVVITDNGEEVVQAKKQTPIVEGPGDYVIPFGLHKGSKLKDIDHSEVTTIYDGIEDGLRDRDIKSVNPLVLTARSALRNYIEGFAPFQMENQSSTTTKPVNPEHPDVI